MRSSSNAYALVAVIALGGCSLMSSFSAGTSSRAGAATSSTTTSSAAAGTGKLVMPDLTGKTADDALAALREAGFEPSFEVNRRALECEGAATEVGRINCQLPQPGEIVDRRAIINVTVYDGPHVFKTSLVRAQLVKLRGMTIADAKAYLKQLGHDGEVAVFEQQVFSDRCAVHTVCDVDPEAGTGIHDRIMLLINPNSNVDIRLPP